MSSAAPVPVHHAVRCTHDNDDKFNLNEMAFKMYSSNLSSAMSHLRSSPAHTVCRTNQLRDTGPPSPCNMDGIPDVFATASGWLRDLVQHSAPAQHGAPVHYAKIEMHRDSTPDILRQPESLDESFTLSSPLPQLPATQWGGRRSVRCTLSATAQ